jgi:hypothetical protein
MRPKLKEDPREWRRFTLSSTAAAALFTGLMLYRGKVAPSTATTVLVVLGVVALAAGFRPAGFRSFYRVGMTIGAAIGQVMGRILLTLFFLLALTPMALVFRVLGKDLLSLRWDKSAKTYWRTAKPYGDLDRSF